MYNNSFWSYSTRMKMKKTLTFHEAQVGAFEILKFIDRICKENKLTYFLMFGSLIGAIRDKGIIPWDDDIDIMMPRTDYDKLVKLCKEKNEEIYPFKLYENSIESEYPHPIARMSDQRYKIEFDNEKDYGIGLFVDIYPLDGIGNNMKKARKYAHRSYRNASLCFLTSRKKFGVDNTTSKLRMIIKFPAYLWANMMGNAHYITKSDKLCRKYSYLESKYVACIAQPWREKIRENKNIYKKEWFEPIEAEFEGESFYIPREYDRILKMGYGDYMTPLPENQRQQHHTYETYRIE